MFNWIWFPALLIVNCVGWKSLKIIFIREIFLSISGNSSSNNNKNSDNIIILL